jgi:hypothetical protein
MKDRDFYRLAKQGVKTPSALNTQEKHDLVKECVRRRMPIAKEFLAPSIDRRWLHACGYLYENNRWVYTVEHEYIVGREGRRPPGTPAYGEGDREGARVSVLQVGVLDALGAAVHYGAE